MPFACLGSPISERLSILNACSANTCDTNSGSKRAYIALDGSADVSEAKIDRRRASAGQAEEPTTVERLLAPSITRTRVRGHTVGDRIRILDEQRNRNDATSAQSIKPSIAGTTVNANGSSLARRMNHFVRRDVDAKPIQTDSPMAKSKAPLQSPRILAPAPHRGIPVLSPAIEEDVTLHGSTKAGKEPARRQAVCPRHGRNLLPQPKSKTTTTDGMEKGFNGAYVPTGRKIRHQVEYTSPWYVCATSLTKREGTLLSPDLCPDCLVEQEIKQREYREALKADVPLTNPDVAKSDTDCLSTKTEPGTPVLESDRNISLVGTTDDHQMADLPGASVVDLPLGHAGSLIAADLGDMIDAIIIEHRGVINKVITNMRSDVPRPDKLQQLSQELARVSDAVATMRATNIYVLPQDRQPQPPSNVYSVILDTPPDFLRTRTKSIPDLIEYIDSAARDLGVSIQQVRDHEEVDNGQLALEDEGGELLSTRPTFEKVSQDSFLLAPSVKMERSKSSASVYATPYPSPPAYPSDLGASIPGAINLTFSPTAIRPSEVRRSCSGSDAGAATKGDFAIRDFASDILSKEGSDDNPPVAILPSNTTVDPKEQRYILGPTESQTTSSQTEPCRIPGLKRTASAPRKYLPGGFKASSAPWSKAEVALPAPLKPSQVREQQKQQGTFQQPWLTNAAKDAAWRERHERRKRLGEDV